MADQEVAFAVRGVGEGGRGESVGVGDVVERDEGGLQGPTLSAYARKRVRGRTYRVELAIAEQDLRCCRDARVKLRDGLDAGRAVPSERDGGSEAVRQGALLSAPPISEETCASANEDGTHVQNVMSGCFCSM